MIDCGKYYDIPYIEDSSDMSGCDCFGLVRLWYVDNLKIKLPEYHGNPESLCDLFMPVKINEVQEHDVIFFDYSAGFHVGISLDKSVFIHSVKNIGVVVSKISTWKRRIRGIYRYAIIT